MRLPGQLETSGVAAISSPPVSALAPVVTGLGFDPGLASCGIAGVTRQVDGTYVSRGVRLSRTEPAKGKGHIKARVAVDDHRRINDHIDVIAEVVRVLQPDVIAIENYSIFEPRSVQELREAAHALIDGLPLDDAQRLNASLCSLLERSALEPALQELARCLTASGDAIGLGQAAKTVRVFGAIEAIARVHKIPVFVFQPSDLKVHFGGRKGASKDEVRTGVERIVSGLAEDIAERVPQKALKEHVGDAAAHAVLGVEAYLELRLNLGA